MEKLYVIKMTQDLQEVIETVIRKALTSYQGTGKDMPEYVLKSEAARILRISPITLQKYIDQGFIKADIIGERLRIKRSDLNNFNLNDYKHKRSDGCKL